MNVPTDLLLSLVEGMKSGAIVPYLGPGTLNGVKEKSTGNPIPADSDSLILAMNDGKPMAPRLMYEFPRAAMNLENKKGRKFIERFLDTTYGEKEWSTSPLHQWLADSDIPYIIDINRDTQLQLMMAGRSFTLIVGVSRIVGNDYRFRIYEYANGEYKEISQEQINTGLPVLFKPMGSPLPEANYVASDADYVDYITELMGGFAVPSLLKSYRKGKQYLFLGMRMTRDTERMVLSDLIYDSGEPGGWVLLPDASEKEIRFCKKKKLVVVDADWDDLIAAASSEVEIAV